MKVIDLLNKIANEEEVPKKIKVNNLFIYEYDGIDYKSKDGTYLFDSYITIRKEDLNMKVEIIEDTPKEDTPKEDKKITKFCYDIDNNSDVGIIINKLNEIIDRLNGEDDVSHKDSELS